MNTLRAEPENEWLEKVKRLLAENQRIYSEAYRTLPQGRVSFMLELARKGWKST